MDNRVMIQNSIDYIEENLKTEITAQELADQAHFSLFHYYRLFQSAVGMPVMQYIICRKLLHAVYEIQCGGKALDVALEYGFQTHAGFYKAFKREMGYTPSQILKKYKVNKPYKVDLLQEEHILITHKKIKELLKNWNMEQETITDVFHESTGIRNENAFYVGEHYVIKCSAHLNKLKSNLDISASLNETGWTSAALKAENGEEIIEDEGIYFMLTKRLRGSSIKAADLYEGDYKAKARFVGEMIGQLSLALKNVDSVVEDVNAL